MMSELKIEFVRFVQPQTSEYFPLLNLVSPRLDQALTYVQSYSKAVLQSSSAFSNDSIFKYPIARLAYRMGFLGSISIDRE